MPKINELYRGVYNYDDISNIVAYVDEVEAKEIRTFLMSRPYGGKHYHEWQKVAFNQGLL